jgi:hypothetical protein
LAPEGSHEIGAVACPTFVEGSKAANLIQRLASASTIIGSFPRGLKSGKKGRGRLPGCGSRQEDYVAKHRLYNWDGFGNLGRNISSHQGAGFYRTISGNARGEVVRLDNIDVRDAFMAPALLLSLIQPWRAGSVGFCLAGR